MRLVRERVGSVTHIAQPDMRGSGVDRRRVGTELRRFGEQFGGVDLEVPARPGAHRAGIVRMIILDTDGISEPLRPRCSEAVIAWLDAQAAVTLYVTSINAAAVWAGVALLSEGARSECRRAQDAKRDFPVALSPSARRRPLRPGSPRSAVTASPRRAPCGALPRLAMTPTRMA